jgi:hypothetical protein
VVRLHRRHDAQPAEARDVRGIDRLDVLDAVAPPWGPGVGSRAERIAGPRAVDGGRMLEGVERHPDPAVADRVQLDLPAAPVGQGDERIELLRLPGRQAP